MLIGGGMYQYIIRFDVGVHNVALAQQTEGEEELFGIYSNSPDI